MPSFGHFGYTYIDLPFTFVCNKFLPKLVGFLGDFFWAQFLQLELIQVYLFLTS